MGQSAISGPSRKTSRLPGSRAQETLKNDGNHFQVARAELGHEQPPKPSAQYRLALGTQPDEDSMYHMMLIASVSSRTGGGEKLGRSNPPPSCEVRGPSKSHFI